MVELLSGKVAKLSSGIIGNRKPEAPKKNLRGRPETGNRKQETGDRERSKICLRITQIDENFI